jgi:hypothetical protein
MSYLVRELGLSEHYGWLGTETQKTVTIGFYRGVLERMRSEQQQGKERDFELTSKEKSVALGLTGYRLEFLIKQLKQILKTNP